MILVHLQDRLTLLFSFGLLWFCIRRRASRMADCSFEIFCESDQKIQKLKSYEQLREKSRSVLNSEDFKE